MFLQKILDFQKKMLVHGFLWSKSLENKNILKNMDIQLVNKKDWSS